MKRAALVTGVSIATLLGAGSTEVLAWNGNARSWSASQAISPSNPALRVFAKSRSRSDEKAESGARKSSKAADQAPPPPKGVLHIIVSIDKQRATLFADGLPVASTPMSSGTSDHPTPMGLFTVIQKDRHHVSNLYDASMPYMQRITWSGSALHQGPLPGYPASHGCVRLTENFAQLLWKTTKMGARVIITRPEVSPIEFDHARLFVPRPRVAEAPRVVGSIAGSQAVALAQPATISQKISVSQPVATQPATASVAVKIADAGDVVAVMAVVDNGSKAVATAVMTEPASNTPSGEQSTKQSITDGAGGTPGSVSQTTAPVEATRLIEAKPVAPAPAVAAQAAVTAPIEKPATPAPVVVDERPKTMPAATVREANGRPISVFVSLKEAKLYVRQGWKPLFEVPVTFDRPDRPIGTHVYTAMGAKADGSGLRWTVVSIPSGIKRVETKVWNEKKSRDHIRTVEVATPIANASEALDRLVMPQDAVERISELVTPGSSLIVSDNKLSDETGEYTDFIVLTR